MHSVYQEHALALNVRVPVLAGKLAEEAISRDLLHAPEAAMSPHLHSVYRAQALVNMCGYISKVVLERAWQKFLKSVNFKHCNCNVTYIRIVLQNYSE